MHKLNGLIIKIIFTLFTLFIYSCSGGTASSSFGLPSSSILPSDNAPGASDGVTTADNFYVGVDSSTNTVAHVHISGDSTQACSITSTQQSQDITCVVEMPEGDLFYQGLVLKYNVPPSMCRYLARLPYYYYNYEVGKGPAEVSIYQEISSDGTTVMNYTTSVDGSANTSATSYSELNISVATKTPKLTCTYDKSTDDGGRNCCFGKYDYTLRQVVHSGTSSTDTTQTVESDWGGDFLSCISGAGSEWTKLSKEKIPIKIISLTTEGAIEQTYKVTAPIDLGFEIQNNRFVANYYATDSTNSHTGFGPALTPPITARTSLKPYFIDPIDDRNGSVISSTSDSYQFECLDQAFETKHKLKVYVRDWDTYQDYVNYVESKGVTEFPDRGAGLEGVNCAGISGSCNDFYDIDDFVNLELGQGYTTTSGDITSRSDYFPGDE